MKKTFTIVCSAILFTIQTLAANKLNLNDITQGLFRAEYLAAVKSSNDGESYTQMSDDGKKIVKYSFKTGKPISTVFDVATARGQKLDRIDSYIMSPDETKILIQTETNYIYRRSFTAVYYIFDIANNKMEKLSDGGPQQTPLFSPDSKQIAFVRDNNIFLVKLLYDNAESQVTKDGKYNEIINGIPDWVNEEEFNTARSMVFSADSRQICWIRYDERNVKEYSLQMFCGSHPRKDEYFGYPGFYTYKYPIAGEGNSAVSVLSYDIKSHQTRKLQVPLDNDGYIPRIVATKDPTKVAVFTMNRHQDKLSIYMANPLTTIAKLVIEDNVDKYFKTESMVDVKITDNHILMPSDRDGYTHLYLYNLNGQLKRKVVTEDYEVADTYGYDEATGDIYYAARADAPTDVQLFVCHANGKIQRLSDKAGMNGAIFSKSFKYFIHTWNDLNTPTVYTLDNNQGKTLTTLIDNKKLKGKMEEYELGKRELFTFTTSEGVKLYGWMVKPANFNPAKKYPVVMYQYGGPGSQQVFNGWNIGMCGQGAIMEQYLCQQGYIAVCVDNRGCGGRGAEFEKCTYLRLGEKESKDQVEAALWLCKQSYVNANKIAIWGWSYGGWNTLMSLSEGTPVFRCGVAIAPPTCWRYYDSIYTERYMRTPKENPCGYDEVNPIARASKLNGALLICHGLADDNVHFQNTAEYTEALVQADKDFKENIYINRNHGISGGNTRNHLFRQCINFFNQEMK